MNRIKYLYPSPVQVTQFCVWRAAGGAAFFHPEGDKEARRRLRIDRMTAVRELIRRLDLPPAYEQMRVRALGRSPGNVQGTDFLSGPSGELEAELYRVLRLHGYVYRTGPVPDGRPYAPLAATPLTGRQLHVLRLISYGHTTNDIAGQLGMEAHSVRALLGHAREEQACQTTAQLVGCAYRNGWLPDHGEFRMLLGARPELVSITSPGYLAAQDVAA